jgi:hypothetical protein
LIGDRSGRSYAYRLLVCCKAASGVAGAKPLPFFFRK